jgi:primase-polymerase (primpol)-like protein/energy-coupling factor transporter ATP-binding protein EcfA2
MSTVGDIPEELRERPQWVLHRDKVPHAPGGSKASSTDSQTWSTFEEVLDMARTNQYDGIGFVLSSGDPYVGVDLDDCIDGGAIEPWAVEIVEALASYTEVSPSGTGLHIIARGKLPVGGCQTSMPGGGELEMYARERYLTVTGDVLDKAHGTPGDRGDEIKAIHAEHFGSSTGAAGTRSGGSFPHVNGLAGPGNDVEVAAVIEKAKQAKNGEAFTRLWKGDTSAHGHDHSKADFALCSALAFWTGGDPAQMDALFRESGLMRSKWDEERGAETYGQRTIRKALESQSDFYTPSNGRAAPESGGGEAEKGEDDRTQSEVLLDVAAGWDLFHTPQREAYATFEAGGTRQTARIGSSAATDALRHGFYKERDKSPSAQAITDANDTLRAEARFDGEKKDVHLRVAGRTEAGGGAIYIDLCNDAWEAVKITADGWDVVSDPPVKFRRVQGMKALPRPERGGSLKLLRRHVRLSDDGFTLLLGFLVQCLRPVGPYPILELTGEQGSGKSTAAKMIRALVDPSHIPIRTRPRKERDLVIAAENAWALAFDNMSGVQPWLSDALCRLSTGGGFGTRKLYADREEEIFYARRPVILNGINELAGRSDLADRAIRLELEAIPESERRTEADVWERFERDRPALLGALFGAVATALRRESGVELDTLPRMADFARWAVAAEPDFPTLNTNEGGFLNAYEQNREEASESAVEADTVASAVRIMLDEEDEWEGTTTELMEDLRGHLPDPKNPPKDYPSTHQAMTARLKRIMPDLRAVGIEREEQKRKSGSRAFKLCKTDTGGGQIDSRGKTASPASSRHETGSASSNGRSAMTRHDAPPDTASSQKRPTGHTDAYDDAHDAHDAVLGPQSNSTSFEHGERVATPDGEGEVIEVTESGRVVVCHDDDCFGESTRPFDTEQIKEVN